MGTKRKPGLVGFALAISLAALTIAVYAPVRHFEFLNYDDYAYVVENAHVASGLSADNFVWTLTRFESANWHPLTLLSHMLDVQLFGMDAGRHHEMNLALHVLNVLLLFGLLAGATSRAWPSALVAALFAVHPLNIQTVAWIAERKSLLSTAFWLLALLVHVRYRRRPTVWAYVLTLVLAGLALAAKPMAVTLPLTLVLFDVWPIHRGPEGGGPVWGRYLRELGPFLALAAACGVVTIVAQRQAEALQTVTSFPLWVRLGNAVVSYVWYLKAMVWPAGLAVFYPHPMTTLMAADIALSTGVLAAICAAVFKGRSIPGLAVGCLWYAGTLLPVAGIIQVGSQAYADRYAYVPLIGIFIAVVWGVVHLTGGRSSNWQRASGAAGVFWIAALSLSTHAQLPYWHDTKSLFQRAIDVVPDNALAQNNLGMALVKDGRMAEALGHFQAAVKIAPWDTDSRSNLGNALRALGRPDEAVEAYEKALEQSPDDPTIHFNLATALVDLRRVPDATKQLAEAVRLDPEYVKARSLLGTLLYRQGRMSDALEQFREVVRLDPEDQRAAEAVRRLEARPGR